MNEGIEIRCTLGPVSMNERVIHHQEDGIAIASISDTEIRWVFTGRSTLPNLMIHDVVQKALPDRTGNYQLIIAN